MKVDYKGMFDKLLGMDILWGGLKVGWSATKAVAACVVIHKATENVKMNKTLKAIGRSVVFGAIFDPVLGEAADLIKECMEKKSDDQSIQVPEDVLKQAMDQNAAEADYEEDEYDEKEDGGPYSLNELRERANMVLLGHGYCYHKESRMIYNEYPGENGGLNYTEYYDVNGNKARYNVETACWECVKEY